MYAIAAVLLLIGATGSRLWPLWAALALFALWDFGWATSGANDRTAQETTESTTRARTYMSYFVAVYGAAFAYFLLRVSAGSESAIIDLVRTAGVPLRLLVLPFALQTLVMLFLPVTLGGRAVSGSSAPGLQGQLPSGANSAVLVLNAYVEKASTYMLLFSLARIAVHLGR